MDTINILKSSGNDIAAAIGLLETNNLPVEDIQEGTQQFFLAETDIETAGCVAIEYYGESGLLRSLAVRNDFRNRGIAEQLVDIIVQEAKAKGVTRLYLLTTTTDKYFARLGWQVIDRNRVPATILASSEFASVCPSTAVCMSFCIK